MLGAEPGVALVAVGGYGRKELLPGSDLDVLMLHDGRDGIARIADRIWYPVWDSGARLDHAVRTVPQAEAGGPQRPQGRPRAAARPARRGRRRT